MIIETHDEYLAAKDRMESVFDDPLTDETMALVDAVVDYEAGHDFDWDFTGGAGK